MIWNYVSWRLKAKGLHGWEDEAFVMEKLDRAFASVEWINTYPHYTLYITLS